MDTVCGFLVGLIFGVCLVCKSDIAVIREGKDGSITANYKDTQYILLPQKAEPK